MVRTCQFFKFFEDWFQSWRSNIQHPTSNMGETLFTGEWLIFETVIRNTNISWSSWQVSTVPVLQEDYLSNELLSLLWPHLSSAQPTSHSLTLLLSPLCSLNNYIKSDLAIQTHLSTTFDWSEKWSNFLFVIYVRFSQLMQIHPVQNL